MLPYAVYIFGFWFSVVLGKQLIWNLTEILWESVGRKREPTDKELHADPELPALVGMVERALYTAAILAGKDEFIAVWLGLKAVASWRLWDRLRTTRAEKVISGRSVFNIYLLGNGFSIAYGVLGGWIIQWLVNTPPMWLEVFASILGLLILTDVIQRKVTRTCLDSYRRDKTKSS
jgi:uncharacterized membrane protein